MKMPNFAILKTEADTISHQCQIAYGLWKQNSPKLVSCLIKMVHDCEILKKQVAEILNEEIKRRLND